jgi:hypothetical protein
VECCRARYCRESVIHACVKELVEKHGADPDVATGAGPGAGGAGGLTPLCVAAARGMVSVVRFLAEAGASLTVEGTGRFRLWGASSSSSSSSSSSATGNSSGGGGGKRRLSVAGTHNPLLWGEAMLAAERQAGVAEADLKGLEDAVKVLSTASARAVGIIDDHEGGRLGFYHRRDARRLPSSSSSSSSSPSPSSKGVVASRFLRDTNKVRGFLGMPLLER